MARTAFITGADGFVGLNLTRELLEYGWNVFALSLPSSECPHLKAMGPQILKADITDKAALFEVFPENVDAIFHVAADTSLSTANNERQTAVNVIGTRNMIEGALAKNAKRFIHLSTVAVFGFHEGRIHENSTSNVYSSKINYFISKAQAESEVLKGIKRGLSALIINPANIIGPYDTNGWAQIFIKISQDEFSGIGDGGGSFCHVSEVVKAMREAVDRGRTGERYVLGGADASFHELAQAAQKVVGGRVPKKTRISIHDDLYVMGSIGLLYPPRQETLSHPRNC